MRSFKQIENRRKNISIYYESNLSIFENLNTNLFIITNKFYSRIKNFSRYEIGRFNFYSDPK